MTSEDLTARWPVSLPDLRRYDALALTALVWFLGKFIRYAFPPLFGRFEVIYGSSGKITTQILNGAPYDIFFSADISFPERLRAEGFTATEPAVYALGRIVLFLGAGGGFLLISYLLPDLGDRVDRSPPAAETAERRPDD